MVQELNIVAGLASMAIKGEPLNLMLSVFCMQEGSNLILYDSHPNLKLI